MIAKILLLCSAYSPVVIIYGIRDHNSHQSFLITACGILIGLSFQLVLLVAKRKNVPITEPVTRSDIAVDEVSSYLLTIVFPFAAFPTPTKRDVVALVVFALMLTIVYIQSNRVALNPWFFFFGIKVYNVNFGENSALLLSRFAPSPSDNFARYPIARNLSFCTLKNPPRKVSNAT